MLPDRKKLHELIKQAAQQELLPRFAEVTRRYKSDGSIVTSADIAMLDAVKNSLSTLWPEYAFLAEEMSEQDQQALLNNNNTGMWCLDPLDGTSNFAAGIPFFSTSLALIIKGEIVVGLVYDPIRDECFSAQKWQGACLNHTQLGAPTLEIPLKRCMAVVDFKRLSAPLSERLVTYPPYHSQRNFGSVALEWCWLAAGRVHVYVHGRQRLWDYAAGSLILDELGGYAATLEGVPLRQANCRTCSVVASVDRALFSDWKDWIDKAAI